MLTLALRDVLSFYLDRPTVVFVLYQDPELCGKGGVDFILCEHLRREELLLHHLLQSKFVADWISHKPEGLPTMYIVLQLKHPEYLLARHEVETDVLSMPLHHVGSDPKITIIVQFGVSFE